MLTESITNQGLTYLTLDTTGLVNPVTDTLQPSNLAASKLLSNAIIDNSGC